MWRQNPWLKCSTPRTLFCQHSELQSTNANRLLWMWRLQNSHVRKTNLTKFAKEEKKLKITHRNSALHYTCWMDFPRLFWMDIIQNPVAKEIRDCWDYRPLTGKRLTGKLRGHLYKVFISPTGVKFYTLGKACQAGFPKEECDDGRTNKKPRTNKKGSAKKWNQWYRLHLHSLGILFLTCFRGCSCFCWDLLFSPAGVLQSFPLSTWSQYVPIKLLIAKKILLLYVYLLSQWGCGCASWVVHMWNPCDLNLGIWDVYRQKENMHPCLAAMLVRNTRTAPCMMLNSDMWCPRARLSWLLTSSSEVGSLIPVTNC